MSPRRPAPPTRIQRSGNGHSYYLDGEKVPGVTTILGNGVPKPALVAWGARCAAEAVANALTTAEGKDGQTHIVADQLITELLAWNETRGYRAEKVNRGDPLPRLAVAKILENIRYRDLDAASNRGTEVHALAARLARGEEVDVPDVLTGHVDSYLRFLAEWDPTQALLERVIINRKWRYMGKFDLLAHFPDYGVGLLDVKTSRSGVFAETALQLAGYRYGETMLDGVDDAGNVVEVPMPEVDWCGAVWVRADGYDVYRFDVTPKTHRIFLYAKHLGEWLDWKEGAAATVKSDALDPPRKDDAA